MTTWTVPAARLKGKGARKRDHVVPLSDGALGILEKQPEGSNYLFARQSASGEDGQRRRDQTIALNDNPKYCRLVPLKCGIYTTFVYQEVTGHAEPMTR
ncbi:hypothetical protein XH84_05750 [Bradyrhizobium nanningense]|nr:hypothetical protein XH84_05750 [Bradyrhizobium nanningense]